MRLVLILLIPLYCLPAGFVNAATVSGLYEAEVPVEDVQQQSRASAISTAMGLVLIKLTGNRYAPADPELRPVIRRAETYLREFSYPGENILRVRFDEDSLSRDLRNLDIPVWGIERPSTLIWLVINDESGSRLLGLDGDPDYISMIDNRVRRRGLVLIYPLLDLVDSMSVQPADISWGYLQTILDASRRYPADSILTGSLDSPVPGIWTGTWTAYLNGETRTWQTEGDIPEIVIDEGIDGIADFLAENYIQEDIIDQSSVLIAVTDINDVDQYARALKYLKSLSFVSRVHVNAVMDGEVRFLINAHGGCTALSRAIEIGRRLEPLDQARCSRYRLLP